MTRLRLGQALAVAALALCQLPGRPDEKSPAYIDIGPS